MEREESLIIVLYLALLALSRCKNYAILRLTWLYSDNNKYTWKHIIPSVLLLLGFLWSLNHYRSCKSNKRIYILHYTELLHQDIYTILPIFHYWKEIDIRQYHLPQNQVMYHSVKQLMYDITLTKANFPLSFLAESMLRVWPLPMLHWLFCRRFNQAVITVINLINMPAEGTSQVACPSENILG